MIRFPLRMAWRETRAAWRHFLGFLVCVTLGVAALVGVGTFAANLERTLGREAKALLGGDLELRSARPLDPETEARLAGLVARGAAVAHVRELVGMARAPMRGGALLVEIKAVDDAYPLYGRLETSPSGPGRARLGPTGALVQESLLARLGLGVGEPLVIGSGRFTIAGVIRKEPDRSAAIFSLGPRVLVSAQGLERTGLVQLGSRVRYRTLLRLPAAASADATRAALARELSDPGVRIATFDDAQPGLRRFLSQLTTYLGLVGLTSLLVGGIGVAAGVRTFIRRKLLTIAILKCLGATSRHLLATYLTQALALGALGSAAGSVLGLLVQSLLHPLLAAFVPFAIDAQPAPWVLLRGVAMGLLTTLLCAAWPLLEVRSVPPALILRYPASALPSRRPWLAAAPIGVGLAAVALWQAGSVKVGGLFLIASAAALALLAAGAVGAGELARRLPRLPWLAWRHGITNLSRPGSETTGVVVALGVGVMLLTAVALLEHDLGRALDHEARREAPSFFFIDIQADQVDRFGRAIAAIDGGAVTRPAFTPVVRSRLAAINGVPVTRARWEGREDAWRFTREYVLTFATAPPPGNTVTLGRWWTPAEAAGGPRISVEDEAARALGVSVGSRLTFDIQGVRVEGTVTNLRKVDWESLSANFFVIFSPGALDGAPVTYIATARVPPAAEAGVQDAVAAAFPNVTAIPVRDILERVSSVLERIGVAVRVIALFVIGAGLTVMTGALMTSRSQRLYESVLFRTLGATRSAVARAFAVEYGCMGLTAGLGGTALGALLAWTVLRFTLEVPWALEPARLALGVALTVALALAVGFLGTFRLLGQKPLPVLRRE